MNAIPELWKNHERYKLRDAVDLWAFAFADVPLNLGNRDRVKYRSAYEVAMQEFRQAGIVQSEEYKYMTRVASSDFDVLGRRQGTRVANRENTGNREFIIGTDLAELATAKGKPGLFGFDNDKPTSADAGLSPREENTVLKILSAILKVKYGETIISDLTSERSARFQRVHLDLTRYIDLDEKTLRKYLKRLPD